jgi:Fe-S cluster assembly protein SufD
MSVFTENFSATLPPPTRRSERWKYSSIAKLLKNEISISKEAAQGKNGWPESVSHNPVISLEAYIAVFKNGVFEPTLSNLPTSDGVECVPFSKREQNEELKFSNTYSKKEWIGELNESYRQDGLYLKVHRNVKVDRPIIIHHLTDGIGVASFPRHFIRVEEGGSLKTVVWSSATDDSSGMYNGILEATIAPNASLSMEKVCNEGGEVFHFSYEHIVQERDSRLKMNTFTIKGNWVRNELEVISLGKGTDSVFNGAYLPKGTEHVDNHTTIDHTCSDGTSSEMYRGVLYGNSTGVFNGKVFVRKDAQKTNAFQQNTNIVADRGASINAKPELEIYADDVKCAHGCTVGQFDLDSIFYLKSRGIDEKYAKALLVEALLNDVLSCVFCLELREEIMRLYTERHEW